MESSENRSNLSEVGSKRDEDLAEEDVAKDVVADVDFVKEDIADLAQDVVNEDVAKYFTIGSRGPQEEVKTTNGDENQV